MEFASKLKWILIIFILLFVLILVGWGLSAVARSVFSGSNDKDTSVVVEPVETSINGVSTVSYTVDGPVVASSLHRSYKIDVSSSVVRMRVFSDFGQKVISEKSYTNNETAYSNFVFSLERANATARFEGTDEEDDVADQGVCPKGYRYILAIGDDIRRWTTSCDRTQGTAAGQMTTIRSLFIKQIPDFSALIKDTGLSSN